MQIFKPPLQRRRSAGRHGVGGALVSRLSGGAVSEFVGPTPEPDGHAKPEGAHQHRQEHIGAK